MKENCCVCGKPVRISMLLGHTGQQLKDGVACYDCCKIAGYGKGVLGAMGLALVTKEEFIQQYNASPKAKKIIETCTNDSKITRMDTYEIDYSKLSDEQLREEMRRFVITNAGISLQVGEICFFETRCCSVKYKDVVVGTSRTSTHLGSSRKGSYIGAGMSQRINNRQIVSEKYPGNFYVTNKRMICNSIKLSFEVPLTKITTMTTYSDGLTIMSAGKTYNVTFDNVEQFKKLIQINNEIERRKNETEEFASSTVNESDIPKLLREYKRLLDEGIISEEEFNQKKEQLLSKNRLN